MIFEYNEENKTRNKDKSININHYNLKNNIKVLTGKAKSATGTKINKPFQDALEWKIIRQGKAEILIAALADGAGSAKKSHEGASLAVQNFINYVDRKIKTKMKQKYLPFFINKPNKLSYLFWDRNLIKNAFENCYKKISIEASASSNDISEYNTTLVGLLAIREHEGESVLFCGSIGDSVSIVMRREDSFTKKVFIKGNKIDHNTNIEGMKTNLIKVEQFLEITKGEYSNETVFLTFKDWEKYYAEGIIQNLLGVILASDGLNNIYFKQMQKLVNNSNKYTWIVEPNEEILLKLFHFFLKQEINNKIFSDVLKKDKIMNFNNDDKSLLLAIF